MTERANQEERKPPTARERKRLGCAWWIGFFAVALAGGSEIGAQGADTRRWDPVVLAEDGAWCWFGNPRAIFVDGVLYYGYVRQADGRVCLSAYDRKTDNTTVLWSGGATERDDHDNPGICALNDGRLLAIYATHGRVRGFYHRVSGPGAGLKTNWSEEFAFTNTTWGVTYSNPIQLAGESNRVYNFMRNVNLNPTFTVSEDSGTNWSAPRPLILSGNGKVRPYAQYASDADRRIDFIYTDGHPLASTTNSLYHGYYEAGAIRRTDGTLVKRLADGPLRHDAGERGSVIYRHSMAVAESPDEHLPGGRAWCWDLAYQAPGTPVCVFSVQVTNVMGTNWFDDRLYYYYARWTGAKWEKRFIAHAGRPLYQGEQDYAGGITLDPNDTRVLYLSSNAADPFDTARTAPVPLAKSERYEIWRGVTADGGRTFRWQAVTRGSNADNLRPYVPRGNSYPVGVVWFAGEYRSYTDWDTSVYGLFAQER